MTETTFQDYLNQTAGLPEDAFLGTLVWYTVPEAVSITPDDLERLFGELGLDPTHLPNPLTAANAFTKATGDSPTAKTTYTLADGHEARVRIENVSSNRDAIYRKVVRVRVDERGKTIGHAIVGDATFYKANTGPGTERLKFAIHDGELQPGERVHLESYIKTVYDDYIRRKTFLLDMAIRGVFRNYVASLNAISVRPSGGMYFVHRDRWSEVNKLMLLAERLGATLEACPLPDFPRQQEMLVEAFQAEAEKAVIKLVEDIEKVRDAGKEITPEVLARFGADVKAIEMRALEHSRIFNCSQDRTSNALEIAYEVIRGLTQNLGDAA